MKRTKNFIPPSVSDPDKPQEVGLIAPPMVITQSEATQLAENLGLLKLQAEQFDDLTKLGIYLSGQGVYRTTIGEAMIARRKFIGLMDKIYEKAAQEGTAIEVLLDCGKVVAMMQSKLNDSLKGTKDVADSQKLPNFAGGNPEPPVKTNTSFPVGSTQIVAQTVHMHPAPSTTTP